MLGHLMMLIAFSYAIFVLISSFYNPFVVVKRSLKKRKVQLGRATAVASLVAGTVAIVILHIYGVSARSAWATYIILLGLFMVPNIIKYRKQSIWR